jgi:hypothetical protein
VRKVITAGVAIVTLAACASAPGSASRPTMSSQSGAVGGPDASSAVRGFMAAAKLQSVQSLAMWWGDASGPSREVMEHDQLEKRELIMLRCLKHDRYDVVGEAPSENGAHDVIINVVYRNAQNTTHMTVVPGPHSRWFVQDVDLKPLHAVCTS